MAYVGRANFPPGGIGYMRGSDFIAEGSGAGAGIMAQGTSSLGQGLGSVGAVAGQWEPSVLYLIGLVIGEMIFFHILSRILK